MNRKKIMLAIVGFILAVAIVLPLIILGVNSSAYFTAADFRTLTEKMISKGREMERAGSLAESFIR